MNVSHSALSVADALLDDPFYDAITIDFAEQPGERRQRLARYVVCSMHEAEQVGCLEAADEGAALWITELNAEALERSRQVKLNELTSVLGPRGLSNYHRMVDGMGARLQGAEFESAWYLSIVGVSPAAQGRGLGARLLSPTLKAADASDASCYLETFGVRTLPFYQRLGFRAVQKLLDDVSGQPYWVMFRSWQAPG